MVAVLTLLCSGCNEVDIKDFQGCSPIPNVMSPTPPDLGAVCDQFLVSNQQILSHDEWVATQAQWNAEGKGVECVPTSAIADLKKEVEKLCSVVKCNYIIKQKIIAGLERLQATAALTKGVP